MSSFVVYQDENSYGQRIPNQRTRSKRIAFTELDDNLQLDNKRIKTCSSPNVHRTLINVDKGNNEDKNAKIREKTKSKKNGEQGKNKEDSDSFRNLQLNKKKTGSSLNDLKTDFEYKSDIYDYLMYLELSYKMPYGKYFEKHPELIPTKRSVLITWLVDLTEQYAMNAQTLHLAVQYVDRFFTKSVVTNDKLQLLGVVAMVIASKVEEVYPPGIDEFIHMCDNTYSSSQIKNMEKKVLTSLKFRVQPPTILAFINHVCALNYLGEKTLYLAMFFSELALLEGLNFVYLPSKLAAASILLARIILKLEPWPRELILLTKYSSKQLGLIIRKLQSAFKNSTSNLGKLIYNKYSSNKYYKVAQLQPNDDPEF